MEPNVDLMGVAGITFVVAMSLIIAWIGRAVILKGMDMSLARDQAKHNLKHEAELRRMAQQATQAQDSLAQRITGRLDAIDERLAAVERLLREVDEPAVARAQ